MNLTEFGITEINMNFYQIPICFYFEKGCLTDTLNIIVNNHLITKKINWYFLEIPKNRILLQSRLLSLVIRSVNS